MDQTQIADLMERELDRGKLVHVLTGEPDQAAQIGEVLRMRVGISEVAAVDHRTNSMPERRVVVGAAAAMCFLYLRVCLRGDPERDRAETLLQGTHAIVMNVTPEERLSPCSVIDCSDKASRDQCTVLASLTLPEFLAKYGSKTECTM